MTLQNPELISGRTMIRMIGILAFLLPIIVVFGSLWFDDCTELLGSISAYYHSGSRDVFVGMLSALAFAFFAYQGYPTEERLSDKMLGNITALFALGVAFFPTSIDGSETNSCINELNTHLYSKLHYFSAVMLFISLAYFSLFRFTKFNAKHSYWDKAHRHEIPAEKLKDIYIYILCGGMIVICLLCAMLYFVLFDGNSRTSYKFIKPIFILETIMIYSFGVAWLIKGRTFTALRSLFKR
jgi:heme/copper-type cytochrome/quinol oxidase subunit 4